MLSASISHKSDVGGVAVNIAPEDIGARLAAMRDTVRRHTGHAPDRFLVQEMIGNGVELILGTHRDALGTAILLGMGGVTAELFQDTALRLLPESGALTRAEALSMVRELKTWPLLDGYRGRPKADVDALVDAIVAFSQMAAVLGGCVRRTAWRCLVHDSMQRGVPAMTQSAARNTRTVDIENRQDRQDHRSHQDREDALHDVRDAAAFVHDLAQQARVHITDAGGSRMVWRRFGAGPHVLLVHGGHGSWLHWVRNVAALSARHTVWVPDLPGFGASGNPGDGVLQTLVDTIVAGFAQLPVDGPVDVIGFSF
uniref:AB hydrolase-1 domain-containing protein n=1 Tax=Solanum lycopersicum TaxID=4081 RepID=A0A494G9X9_SOLLC